MEITVSSLEEMCDLMCDNKIPEKKPMKACRNGNCNYKEKNNDKQSNKVSTLSNKRANN